MADQIDLDALLKDLDEFYDPNVLYQQAARAIRELRADFERYAPMAFRAIVLENAYAEDVLEKGLELEAARARWARKEKA